MPTVISYRIRFRRGTAAEWTAANPVLLEAEPGYETDTDKVKYGDGSTAWNSLAYFTVAAAGNVAFPATQVPSADPNTLDDYEEGTFTPTLTFGGGSTGMTFTTQVGRYTKIGRLVFFEIRLLLSAKGSSTGNAVVGGLPFTSNASGPTPQPVVQILNATVTLPGLRFQNNASAMNVIEVSGGTLALLNDTHFTNTTDMRIQGFYTV